jgi:ectoine hydroxylase-related dioxygenase (phytanoyl-CoA dioxygenase family)
MPAPQLNLQDFAKLCEQGLDLKAYPLAASAEKNVLLYSGEQIRAQLHSNEFLADLKAEWAQVLQSGSGVLVIQNAFANLNVITRMNQVFEAIFAQEVHKASGDHFAKAGANGRIWNVLQKSALQDPQAFIDYYKNPLLQLASEAWLGPHYQVTAQVNVVRPGGQAQAPHRDYHLGFQEQNELARYPMHAHLMSAQLTLQGAVAHTDMPLESGPTLLLPFSQQYELGYFAWRNPEFKAYFDAHAIQLPLKQGDALFFNPALFHAAGSNHTQDFHRSANLLQVSSAFGRAMEQIDRYAMTQALYPALAQTWQDLTAAERDAVLSSACEGYSFPTNLDSDPPLNGLAPLTMKQLTEQALNQGTASSAFLAQLAQHQQKRQA